jgi:hypothetical protein
VKTIGGHFSLEDNGYAILAKEYKREIKYSAGNLMQLYLSEVLNRSIETLFNFYKGIPSLSTLRKALKG